MGKAPRAYPFTSRTSFRLPFLYAPVCVPGWRCLDFPLPPGLRGEIRERNFWEATVALPRFLLDPFIFPIRPRSRPTSSLAWGLGSPDHSRQSPSLSSPSPQRGDCSPLVALHLSSPLLRVVPGRPCATSSMTQLAHSGSSLVSPVRAFLSSAHPVDRFRPYFSAVCT